jgi:hypothetical protein
MKKASALVFWRSSEALKRVEQSEASGVRQTDARFPALLFLNNLFFMLLGRTSGRTSTLS